MARKLSQNQLKELKECFDLFDNDKSGNISTKELKKVCESLGIKVKDTEVKDLMRLMDRDGSGAIDFNEFVSVMAEQFYRQPSRAELEAAFDHFDHDKSGYITEDELYLVMSRFKGTNITKADIHRMVQSVDKDNDSKINKKEFIAVILNSK